MDAPLPRTPSARACRAALRSLGGWRYEGEMPQPKRAVCLAVPHTDNMDGLLLVLIAGSIGMNISWMVKDDWTKAPVVGRLVKKVGGVGIDRSQARGMVGSMIEAFETNESLYLVIPPEGTRSYADHWKSGFYRIARGANVPILPGFLDYSRKRGGFGEPIELTGDVGKDMDRLRAFYADAKTMARHPEKFGPIKLRDESTPAEAEA